MFTKKRDRSRAHRSPVSRRPIKISGNRNDSSSSGWTRRIAFSADDPLFIRCSVRENRDASE